MLRIAQTSSTRQGGTMPSLGCPVPGAERPTSDNLVRATDLTFREEVSTIKETTNTMSDTTNTNTTVGTEQDVNDRPSNVKAREQVFATILPNLIAARDANVNATELSIVAGTGIVDARLTYFVTIDGNEYQDLFAVGQATKNGISAFFKTNGIPVSQESGASTLRYHASKNAEKRFADATPGTYGPAGWICKGGKWMPEPTQEQISAADAKRKVDAVAAQVDRTIGLALDKKATEVPANVLNLLADRLTNLATNWNDLSLKGSDRANVLSGIANLQMALDHLSGVVTGMTVVEEAA